MQKEILTEAKHIFGTDIVAIVNLYSMTFVWASNIFAAPLGYTSDEMNGMSARQVMALDYEGVVSLAVMLASSKQLEDEKSLKKKDGTIVKTRAVLSAFTFDKERYVVVHRITFLDT